MTNMWAITWRQFSFTTPWGSQVDLLSCDRESYRPLMPPTTLHPEPRTTTPNKQTARNKGDTPYRGWTIKNPINISNLYFLRALSGLGLLGGGMATELRGYVYVANEKNISPEYCFAYTNERIVIENFRGRAMSFFNTSATHWGILSTAFVIYLFICVEAHYAFA